MGSTRQRSFVKGMSWEFISFVITLAAVYLIYGNIIFSIKFSVILSVIKLFFFYIHERAWKKLKWGKIKDGDKNNSSI